MELEDPETVESTRAWLGDLYEKIPFVEESEARALDARRDEFLASIAERVRFSAGGAKAHVGDLSPGCARCVEGSWSCLFLDAGCGASCFFCPGQAKSGGNPPRAEGIGFDRPGDYADYAGRFGFRGVSVSGGDPLLDPNSVLEHLRALRRRLGDAPHLWLYTNGLAARDAVLVSLRDAGLDEVRLNIAAVGYSLDRVARAAEILDRVTVEIPAIPEDAEIVRRLLPEMNRIGVRHVNLNQLMLFPGNHRALRARGYRFTHGVIPAVPESELTALGLLEHALTEGLELPVHYCSRAYKARWQARAQDARLSGKVRLGFEETSGRGLVRRIGVEMPNGDGALVDRLRARDRTGERFLRDRDRGRVYLHSSLLSALDSERDEASVEYFRPLPLLDPDAERPFPGTDLREVHIDSRRTLGVELRRVADLGPLDRGETDLLVMAGRAVGEGRAPNWPPGLDPFECMPAGFPDYL